MCLMGEDVIVGAQKAACRAVQEKITSINYSDPLSPGGQPGSLSVGSDLVAQKVWDPVF